jgi:crossover junction endodeoxyribonuclease RuvC
VETRYPFSGGGAPLLKKFVAGKGNVDKNVVLKEVFKRWQFDTDDDNIADAFVLMQIGRCLAGQLPAQNEVQVKIISELYKNIPGMLAGMHSNQQ